MAATYLWLSRGKYTSVSNEILDMSHRRLEVKVIKGEGSDPETFEIPLSSKDGKFNLFVFRGPITMKTSDIQNLVEISQQMSGDPCTAVVLGESDQFEVYEVEIPTRYERTPVI